jgi:hypothetical protein
MNQAWCIGLGYPVDDKAEDLFLWLDLIIELKRPHLAFYGLDYLGKDEEERTIKQLQVTVRLSSITTNRMARDGIRWKYSK